MKVIGRNIKSGRKKLGLSQEKLRILLEISKVTLISWEAGRTEPNASQIIKLSLLFSCSVHDLLIGDVNTKPKDSSNSNLLVPNTAQAGHPAEWSQAGVDHKIMNVIIPGITGEARTFEVIGDSMAPALIFGDWVSCKRVEHKNQIADGKIYALVTSTQGVTIKYLQRFQEGLKCIPHNTNGHHSFIIPYDEVKEIWEAKIRVTQYLITPLYDKPNQ